MTMAWQFKREEAEFEEIPEGRYRVMIVSAEMAVSKSSGNDMLVIKLQLSNSKRNLWNYITFLDDRPEITNRMLTQFFDSFGIGDGDFNLSDYIGKVGGCQVKHDEQGRAKVQYFLSKKQQEPLPPWVGDAPVQAGKFQDLEEPDDDLPF